MVSGPLNPVALLLRKLLGCFFDHQYTNSNAMNSCVHLQPVATTETNTYMLTSSVITKKELYSLHIGEGIARNGAEKKRHDIRPHRHPVTWHQAPRRRCRCRRRRRRRRRPRQPSSPVRACWRRPACPPAARSSGRRTSGSPGCPTTS